MKTLLATLFVIIGLTSNAISEEALKPTFGKAELQQLYISHLEAEGYKPKIDSDGDIQFKREGNTYFIDVNNPTTDAAFFRIVLANIWSIQTPEERVRVLEAADKSNSKSKVSKIFTLGNNTWATSEAFISRPEDFKGTFTRLMSALDNGVVNFLKMMRN